MEDQSAPRRRELCCRIKRARDLRTTAGGAGPFWAYAVARLGAVRHRTHVIESSSSPEWNEKVVFDARSVQAGGSVATFEIWTQGYLTDDLLSKAYLDLDLLDLDPSDDLDAAGSKDGSVGDMQRQEGVADNAEGRAPAGAAAPAASQTPRPSPAASAATSRRTTGTGGGAPPRRAAGAGGAAGPVCSESLVLLPATSIPARARPQPGDARRALSRGATLQSKTKLRRSGRVVQLGELEVEVYWVEEPSYGSEGAAPRVLSFVGLPNERRPLPCTTHVGPATMYEEPCVAYVKLSINIISLGLAGAHASPHEVMQHVEKLLLGGQGAKDQMDKLMTKPASCAPGGGGVAVAALGGRDEAGAWGLRAGPAAESVEMDWSSLDSGEEVVTVVDACGQQHTVDRRQALFLTCRVRLESSWGTKTCQPAQVGLDGNAAVHQSLVFAVQRPLEDCTVNFEVGMHHGYNGFCRLALTFSYSLLQLLSRSPPHPYTFEEWRLLNKDCLPGMHVPLPGLPDSYLDLSAFLADADCRAGIYQVPALSDACRARAEEDWRQRGGAAAAAADALTASAAAATGAGGRQGPGGFDPILEGEPAQELGSEDGGEGGGGGGAGGKGGACGCGHLGCALCAAEARLEALSDDDRLSGADDAPLTGSDDDGGGDEGVMSPPASPVAGTRRAAAPAGMGESASEGAGASSFGSEGRLETMSEGGSRRRFLRRRVAGKVRAALARALGDEPPPAPSPLPHAAGDAAGGGSQPSTSAAGGSPPGASHRHHLHRMGAHRTHMGGAARQLEQKWEAAAQQFEEVVEKRLATAANKAVDLLPAPVARRVRSANLFRRLFPGASKKVLAFGQLRVPSQKHFASPFDAVAEDFQNHPNLAVSGSTETAPIAVLDLTIQGIDLHRSPGSGYTLVVRCGPHWASVAQPGVPLAFSAAARRDAGCSDGGEEGAAPAAAGGGGGGGGGTGGGAGRDAAGAPAAAEGNGGAPRPPQHSTSCSSIATQLAGVTAQPLQMLFPVYGTNHTAFSLVLHRQGSVAARLTFRVTSLLPLVGRSHTKCLTLYRDGHDEFGRRGIAGRAIVKFSARHAPGWEGRLGALRVVWSYLLTPLPLAMLTSSVKASTTSDRLESEARAFVERWLSSVSPPIPTAVVKRAMPRSRAHLSRRRVRAHLQRLKEVTDWVPRKWDPMGLYFWKRPWVNLLTLWVLSHVCLHPAEWLFSVTAVAAVWMLRKAVIQMRAGIVGYEVACPVDEDADEDEEDDAQQRDATTELARMLWSQRSSSSSLAVRDSFDKAAMEFRRQLRESPSAASSAATPAPRGSRGAAAASANKAAAKRAAALEDVTLEALQRQLQDGELDFSAVEALAEQMTSITGVVRLLKTHSAHMRQYALLAQNLADDVISVAEGLHAMAFSRDAVAAAWFYAALLFAFGFCWLAGLGWGIFIMICYLLRPPFLRGVPAVFGFRAFFSNLPARSADDFM